MEDKYAARISIEMIRLFKWVMVSFVISGCIYGSILAITNQKSNTNETPQQVIEE